MEVKHAQARRLAHLITYEYPGRIDNLKLRAVLFGKLIVLREMMARSAGDRE